jgi:hypothetical protein
MTLRKALGGDTERLHELVEELLDREDAVVLLFDGDRAVNYISGFGLSPSQHEFMALEIERMFRTAATAELDDGTGGAEFATKQRKNERRLLCLTPT